MPTSHLCVYLTLHVGTLPSWAMPTSCSLSTFVKHPHFMNAIHLCVSCSLHVLITPWWTHTTSCVLPTLVNPYHFMHHLHFNGEHALHALCPLLWPVDTSCIYSTLVKPKHFMPHAHKGAGKYTYLETSYTRPYLNLLNSRGHLRVYVYQTPGIQPTQKIQAFGIPDWLI